MAKRRTELEARLLEEHERVLTVVQRWQSEQQAVDEVRASLADAEARLDEAVLEVAELGDRSMVARLLGLPEAQVRKAMADSRRAAKKRVAEAQLQKPDRADVPVQGRSDVSGQLSRDRHGRVESERVE